MQTKFSVNILHTDWLPVAGDRAELEIRYEVVPSPATATSPRSRMAARIVVSISGTLQAIWRLQGRALESVLVAYAKQHIADKLQDESLLVAERLELSTYNSPSSSPFDPALKDYYMPTGFEVETEPPAHDTSVTSSQLGARIAGLRDAINAVFGEKFDSRLLSLPQERALSDLSHACRSEEEFAFRASALCIMATSIDASSLPAVGNGPLDALGAFLRERAGEDEASRILKPLTEFNHLRRMYPVHTDRAAGVVAAFRYFNIDYPVRDFRAAWNILRMRYIQVLEELLTLVRSL